MSSQPASASAPASNQRQVKLTAACETCRRRKARCSGTTPCLFCQKNSFRCEFNYDRRRRGPKTKRSHSDSVEKPERASEVSLEQDCVPYKASGPGNSNGLQVSGNISFPAPEKTEELWRVAVRRIVGENQRITGELELSSDLIIHLLIIFITHVHNHQPWAFTPSDFLARLGNQDCSIALLCAISAASLKFSRHPSAIARVEQSRGRQYSTHARQQMVYTLDRSSLIDRVQCFCILAMYEIGAGNGSQAWCDISAAYSLIQVALAMDVPGSEDYRFLKSAHQYLLILEREFCLGHKLTPSIHHLSSSELCPLLESEPETRPVSTYLSDILDLLLRIQSFSRETYSEQHPSPWSVDSEFMIHREALDRILIYHSDEFQFVSEELTRPGGDTKAQLENLHCSLAWHCAVILLNRVFLPIPTTPEEESPNLSTSVTPQACYRYFPLAPKPFLEERIQASETSASTICDICKDVLDSESFLMPSFMGYCCFQSSVVLINKLRRTRGSDKKVIEELKVNFTILGAMRKFYEPAHAWADTLFELHQPNVHSHLQDSDASSLFAGYFARFKKITEPPYVPFEAPQCSEDVPMASSPPDRFAGSDSEALPFEQPPSRLSNDEQLASMSQYRNSIQAHILGLDDEPVPCDDVSAASQLHILSRPSPDLQIISRTSNTQETNQDSHDEPKSRSTKGVSHTGYAKQLGQPDSENQPQSVLSQQVPGILTAEESERISFHVTPDDLNSFGNSQNPIQLIPYDHHMHSIDFDLFALLQAGEEMFPPLDFLPIQSNFDWSLSNGNGDSEGAY